MRGRSAWTTGDRLNFLRGEYFLPPASITQGLKSASSATSGRTRVTTPSVTYTDTGPLFVRLVKTCSPIERPPTSSVARLVDHLHPTGVWSRLLHLVQTLISSGSNAYTAFE